MDLKNFITETLHQIVNGVHAAQKKIATFNYETASNFQLMTPEKTNRQNVYFDVALTVVKDQQEPPVSSLRVIGQSHLSADSVPIVSRIKFSVSLTYTPIPVDKNPYLFLNTH